MLRFDPERIFPRDYTLYNRVIQNDDTGPRRNVRVQEESSGLTVVVAPISGTNRECSGRRAGSPVESDLASPSTSLSVFLLTSTARRDAGGAVLRARARVPPLDLVNRPSPI
jgi:hypothetical protein